MTGPQHYEEAERLLHLRRDLPADREIAMAQVHATLALAAAVAALFTPGGQGFVAGQAWQEATARFMQEAAER